MAGPNATEEADHTLPEHTVAHPTTKDLLQEAADHLPTDASVEEALERLLFLATIERGKGRAARQPHDVAIPPHTHELQQILDELARNAPFASLDALNAELARRMHVYTSTPQATLGGLSPDRVAQLRSSDWTNHGAFRDAGDAPRSPLLDVPIAADARLMLSSRYLRNAADSYGDSTVTWVMVIVTAIRSPSGRCQTASQALGNGRSPNRRQSRMCPDHGVSTPVP